MNIPAKTRPTLRTASLLIMAVIVNVASAQATAKVPPRPTPRPAKVPVFPRITLDTLPNGIQLAVVENHTLPVVAVRVGFVGGYFLDAPGKEGGWALMTTMLQEGSTTRCAAAIAGATADYGTGLTWSQGVPYMGGPFFTTVRSAFQPVVEVVADVLMHPGLPADAFRRVQGLQAAAAAHPPQQTASIGLLNAILYGNHPYGRHPAEASIRALTPDDIAAIQTTYLRPQNTIVAVAGDITPAEARRVVERAFASWERGGATVEANIPAPAARAEPTTIFLRDDPGASTSTIVTGSVVPDRAASDATAIEAVNAVLGGTLGVGRMWQAFRVERGLSYNPSGSILWHARPQVGAWLGIAQVPSAKTDTAVTEWLRVLRETHGDRPLTGEELDFTRSNLIGALPGQMATDDAVANSTLTLLQTRLPLTFYRDQVNRVTALTLEQFRAAATKYLDPERLIIAVVGDRSKIEAPLRATGIPVVIVDH